MDAAHDEPPTPSASASRPTGDVVLLGGASSGKASLARALRRAAACALATPEASADLDVAGAVEDVADGAAALEWPVEVAGSNGSSDSASLLPRIRLWSGAARASVAVVVVVCYDTCSADSFAEAVDLCGSVERSPGAALALVGCKLDLAEAAAAPGAKKTARAVSLEALFEAPVAPTAFRLETSSSSGLNVDLLLKLVQLQAVAARRKRGGLAASVAGAAEAADAEYRRLFGAGEQRSGARLPDGAAALKLAVDATNAAHRALESSAGAGGIGVRSLVDGAIRAAAAGPTEAPWAAAAPTSLLAQTNALSEQLVARLQDLRSGTFLAQPPPPPRSMGATEAPPTAAELEKLFELSGMRVSSAGMARAVGAMAGAGEAKLAQPSEARAAAPPASAQRRPLRLAEPSPRVATRLVFDGSAKASSKKKAPATTPRRRAAAPATAAAPRRRAAAPSSTRSVPAGVGGGRGGVGGGSGGGGGVLKVRLHSGGTAWLDASIATHSPEQIVEAFVRAHPGEVSKAEATALVRAIGRDRGRVS